MTKRVLEIQQVVIVLISVVIVCVAHECKVSNLQVNLFSRNRADIKWKNPDPSKCPPNYNYEVRIRTNNKEALKLQPTTNKKNVIKTVFVNKNKDSVTFDDLELFSCVDYNFTVAVMHCTPNPKKPRKECSNGKRTINSNVKLLNQQPFDSVTYDEADNRTVNFILNPSPAIALCKPIYSFKIFSPLSPDTECSTTELMKNVFETTIMNETSVDVRNLEDCVNYLAFIGVEDPLAKEANQTVPLTVDFSSNPESEWKVNNFSVVQSGTDWIQLAWSPPEIRPQCLKRYELEVHHAEKMVGKLLVGRNVSQNVSEFMEPCKTYRFVLNMVGVKQSANGTLMGSTMAVVPGKVKHLTVINATSTSLTLNWTTPTLGMSCATSYALLLTEEVGSLPIISLLLNVTNYTVHDLHPCTNYTISIRTKGVNMDSEAVEIYHETGLEVPGGVNDFKAANISKNYLILVWSPPSLYQTCVALYELSWRDWNGELLKSVNVDHHSRSYSVTDLEPCSRYTFSIVAVGAKGSSASVNTVAVLNEEVPGPVSNLMVKSLDFQLVASWDPPTVALNCVSNYVVHNQPLNGSRVVHMRDGDKIFYSWIAHSTPNTTRILPDLAACIEYKVIVTAVTPSKVEGPAVSFNQTTLPHVFAAPVHGTLVAGDKASALLSWQVPFTNRNQCPLKELTVHCQNRTGDKFSWKNDTRDENGVVLIRGVGLTSFTTYNCTAQAENLAGLSNESTEMRFETMQDVPSAPRKVQVVGKSSDSISISWEPPTSIPGILKDYNVTVNCQGPQYTVPEDCVTVNSPGYSKTVSSKCSDVLLDKLSPYQECIITVAASTGAGYGSPCTSIKILTLPNVSEVVRNLKVDVNYNESILSWLPPCFSNGIVSYYAIKLTGTRPGFEPEPVKRWNRSKNQESGEIYVEYLTDLQPEYNYEVTVTVLVEDVADGVPHLVRFTSSAKLPDPPLPHILESMEPNPQKTDDPSEQALITIKKTLFNNHKGEIRYYSLLIAQKGFLGPPQHGILASSTSWPRMKSWANATKGSSVQLYQATPCWWDPFKGRSADEIDYIIGSEPCSADNVDAYCNGPLNAATEYELRIRAFTSAGFHDSPPLTFKTEASFPFVFAIRLALSFFIVGCFIVITIYVILRKSAWRTGKPKPNTIQDSEIYLKDQSAKKFMPYCYEVLEKEEKMKAEFQHLQHLSAQIQLTNTVAQLPGNTKKNRYTNILPYDSTRVILEDDLESDYINASYIKDDFDKNIMYIACQGPKDDTSSDFWKMVLQCNIQSVIMLCNLREQGKTKCHWYFPEECESLNFGGITVECGEKNTYEMYIERVLTVNKDGQPKTKVNHFHFLDWPDFGVPSDPATVIRFCQAVRASAPNGRMAVHCSAGVGRTGTFIAVDILLRHIEQLRKFSVFNTVLRLREQRAHMVQTEIQYSYIYKILKQALDNPSQHFRRGPSIFGSHMSARNLARTYSRSLSSSTRS